MKVKVKLRVFFEDGEERFMRIRPCVKGVKYEISDSDILSGLSNSDNYEIVGESKNTGDYSSITYLKIGNFYLRIEDSPGASGYDCCGWITCEYSHKLKYLGFEKKYSIYDWE